MSPPLISRSPDLQRLRDDGYEIEISGSYLLIHSVPYVAADKTVKRGILVSELTLAGDVTAAPSTHVAMFVGDHPCNRDGTEIAQIKHSVVNQTVREGMVAAHQFSNKPAGGYPDYFAKMTRYIEIISAPAQAIDPSATAKTFKLIESTGDSVFEYLDTASSRAGINRVSDKLKPLTIAIIGNGGTGSYVLDLVAKTPVKAIHLFDGDKFFQHNAFRAPGAPSVEELKAAPFKVDYLAAQYARMRKHIVPHTVRIVETNLHLLDAMDFVFICIDRGDARKLIVDYLDARRKSFIDVGMGVELVTDDASLIGVVRVTTSTEQKRDHVTVRHRIPFALGPQDDDYRRNIQIADLNALNAAFAVIKWKKLYGVYQDREEEHHTTYSINVNMLTSEEIKDGA
jgi:hypothetical protein